MNRFMKIKILCVVMSVILAGNTYAAGTPVIDIENIIASIENGYKMVEQLQTMYQQLETAYNTFTTTKAAFEKFDLTKLDASDPLGSYKTIMTYGDRLMTYEDNAKALLTSKTYQWGSQNFSLSDLYNVDKVKKVLTEAWEDPFEKQMTAEEKAAFNQKYGMSYGHYMRYNAFATQMSNAAADVYAYANQQQENTKEDRDRLEKVAKDDPENSAVKAAQQGNTIAVDQAETLKSIAYQNAEGWKLISADLMKKQIEDQNVEDYAMKSTPVKSEFKNALYADDDDNYE